MSQFLLCVHVCVCMWTVGEAYAQTFPKSSIVNISGVWNCLECLRIIVLNHLKAPSPWKGIRLDRKVCIDVCMHVWEMGELEVFKERKQGSIQLWPLSFAALPGPLRLANQLLIHNVKWSSDSISLVSVKSVQVWSLVTCHVRILIFSLQFAALADIHVLSEVL